MSFIIFQVDSIKVGFPSRLGVVTSLALHLFVSLSNMLPAMLTHEKTRTYSTIAENAPQTDFAESSFHEIEPQTYEKLFACNDFAPDFVERGRILGDS
ncbi:MAG: hypothetical protein SOU18_05650 [Alloprevotella sp.]|nr:hypothetical protein [Alloprevotella sp.]